MTGAEQLGGLGGECCNAVGWVSAAMQLVAGRYQGMAPVPWHGALQAITMRRILWAPRRLDSGISCKTCKSTACWPVPPLLHAVAEALIAPAMPSTTARAGGIFMPIINSLSLNAGSKPSDWWGPAPCCRLSAAASLMPASNFFSHNAGSKPSESDAWLLAMFQRLAVRRSICIPSAALTEHQLPAVRRSAQQLTFP